MKSVQLDMRQYDCPYIETTFDHDVTFYATQWDFKHDRRSLETRMLMASDTETGVERAIGSLRESEHLRSVELLSKEGGVAELRSTIDETDAMRTILDNDGYIVGPFVIDDGSEVWNVGFDRAEDTDRALSELDRNNEFSIESESTIDIVDYYDIANNMEALRDIIVGLRDLTETEARTLEAAVSHGYFETPRDATLDDIADEFDISKNGASKNLRRSQRKVLDRVETLIDSLEEHPSSLTATSSLRFKS